jgi:molybdenum cofactor cytidylyltransferase
MLRSAPDLVVAVLAAGASRRLGQPKQLVALDGEPLLRRQCRCALMAGVGNVTAILGCNADQHRLVIQDLPVEVRVSGHWAQGLAATLRCAVRAARLREAALLVLPCDLYRVTPDDLRALCDRWSRSPSRACVSSAGGYTGPPAILPVPYHERILSLRGDIGARALLFQPPWAGPEEVVNPRAPFDLDCADDLREAAAWAERSPA